MLLQCTHQFGLVELRRSCHQPIVPQYMTENLSVLGAGTNYLLNATAFNQSKATGYKNALATLANVPPCWVTVMGVTAYNLNSNGSLGSPARRLLQTLDSGLVPTALDRQSPRGRRLSQSDTGAALGINTFLPSTGASGVLTLLGSAYNNGQLASGILPDPLDLELLNITPASVSPFG